jgi:hypothetical protein
MAEDLNAPSAWLIARRLRQTLYGIISGSSSDGAIADGRGVIEHLRVDRKRFASEVVQPLFVSQAGFSGEDGDMQLPNLVHIASFAQGTAADVFFGCLGCRRWPVEVRRRLPERLVLAASTLRYYVLVAIHQPDRFQLSLVDVKVFLACCLRPVAPTGLHLNSRPTKSLNPVALQKVAHWQTLLATVAELHALVREPLGQCLPPNLTFDGQFLVEMFAHAALCRDKGQFEVILRKAFDFKKPQGSQAASADKDILSELNACTDAVLCGLDLDAVLKSWVWSSAEGHSARSEFKRVGSEVKSKSSVIHQFGTHNQFAAAFSDE